jgi:hypothetical protein
MRHHSVARNDDVGAFVEQMLYGVSELRRAEVLLTSGATIHEPDERVREEQAIAAAVAALKARYYALTGDVIELNYNEVRSLFTVAIDAYHSAHETLRAGSHLDQIGGAR